MPASTAEHWGGSSRSQPDSTLFNNPGAARSDEQFASVGTKTHNVFNNEAALRNMTKDDRFFPYFGQARGIIVPNNYRGMDEENYDLPDAYKGSNDHMRRIIIATVIAAEMWGTRIAFPWKKWDGMEIRWDEWIFNQDLPTRTPEEAVSRVLSSHFSEHSVTTVRSGIAFIMEHGFWKTEKGKQHYALQMVQMRNAIAWGAQYGVTLAALYPPTYVDDQERYRTKNMRGKVAIQNYFQNEIDNFAILQKDSDGFSTLINRLDEQMLNRTQERSDFIIVPLGAKKLINSRPENSFFFLSGGIQKSKFNEEQLTAGNGRMVVESIKQKMGQNEPNHDAVYQLITIGGKFHMVDHHLDMVAPQDFKVSMLDQFIYDEDRDDFYKMSFSYAVRTMGLYTGWDEAQKVGDMPITTELGRKYFKEVATWGEVLFSAGRLDKFIKQLQGKDDDVYEDFIRKFVIAEQPSPSMGMALDEDEEERKQESKYPEEEEEEEKQGAYTNDVSTALLNLQLRDNVHHRTRLEKMLNWLKSLDEQAAKQYGIKSNIASQVSAHISSNQKSLKNLDEKTRTYATYSLAWKLAQDLLIKYGLEVAARENRNGSTPFENYVLTKSKHKSYGGLSEQDERKLQELNQSGPYWKPVGDAFKAEVALIAPETGAGDNNSTTKRLAYLTDAFTLASSFLCLFSVPQASVSKMLHSPNNADKPLFDLAIEFPQTAPNQNELIDRAGLLQFSIIMSAMYTIVSANRKSHASAAEEEAHYTKLAEAWIKLANPINMLTKSEESFAATIEHARGLHTLDYQASIDQLVVALKKALLEMYDAKGAITTRQVILAIRKVELLCVYTQSNNHVCDTGACDIDDDQSGLSSDAGGVLQSLDEPLLDALYGHSRHMGAYTASNRVEKAPHEDFAARIAKLNVASTKLTEMTKALRDPKNKAGGAPKGKDASGHWKPTYIKLMMETDKNSFDAYFQTNEQFLNYMERKPFNTKADAIKLQEKANDNMFYAVLAEIAGAEEPASATSVTAIRDTIGDALNNMPEKNTTNTDSIELALEWTRMWSTNTKTMQDLVKSLGGAPDAGVKLQGLTLGSLLLKKYNFDYLKEKAKSAWPSILSGKPNEKYSQLFINTADKGLAGQGGNIEIIDDGGDGSVLGKRKRLSNDALRNVLMTEISILDGYFWLWSLNHDMVQAIGTMGFRLSKRYEAGTLIMLSAWGKTGNTFYGHCDMMLSDNAATKMHYGHLTYYSKTVVLNSQRIIHGRHCIVKSYEGGNGHMVWDATSDADREDYKNGELTKDIHFVPVLMGHNVDCNHMDATGRYHHALGANDDAQKATAYDASAIYSEFWGWSHDALNLSDASYSNVRAARENTIMFQEHQSMYNSGSGSFDLYVRDKGHWGDRVYPGCGRVRRGLESWLKPVKYDNTSTVAMIV